MRRTNRGITIIVLIITIVVMFILAAVSVNLVIKTDIFNSAKGAVKKTNGKIAETETQVNELLSEWERLNAEWGDNTGGENTIPGGNTTPETCSHIWGAWSTTKAASCTEAGSRKATCTKCRETKTETLKALGHNFVNGSCTRCGTECEHTYSEWTITKEANCEEAGSKTRRCSNCGKVETDTIPAKGHNWNTETGTCKDCGETCTHTWSNWQTITEATCTAEGSKSRTCSVCKHVETESIAATGHSWNASTGKCNTCGTACTHTYGSWQTTTAATCTAAGSKSRTCSVCKHVETESIAATGHSWNASTGKCNTCGTACTHTYGSWSTTTAATCTVAGSKYAKCTTCGYKNVQMIPVLGHNYSNYICTRCGVEKPIKEIADGRYIKYDVAYTDAYKSSYNYTATNGWRLLHATPNGDGTYSEVELISTGIPANFYYYYKNPGTWWVTDTTQLTNFKTLLGGSSYNFYTGTSDYVALKAAAGFYYNFGSLPFTVTSSPSVNNGGYTAITNSDQKSGTTAGTGAGLFLTNKATSVRLLTLKEINEARGITNDPDNTGNITAAQDPTGLYKLNGLTSVPGIGTTSYDTGYYWLASPWTGNDGRAYLTIVRYGGNVSYNYAYDSSATSGVRPVVAISRI